ncbi:MAG TPA: NAD+ synthase, partial [Candidatus Omnitrophica bacterium]|nr:NAD+ synthase [Candidatus Omnitrophota bacterium]
MEKKLRIALAQINPTVGDLKGNRKKIKYFLKQAQQYKVDVVIFPELAICGYPPEDLLLKGHFVRDNLETLNSLIEETSGIVMIVGFVDSDEKGNLYNSAAIVQNGQLKGIYHKFELPNYGVFDEKRYFQPGERVPLFKLGGTIFGVTICEDIWKRDGVVKLEADRGAQLIINISASPYHAGKRELRKQILTERVRETKTHICYTNQIGGQDELVFDGGSAIIDPDGEIIAKGMEFEEDLVMGDLRIRESLKEDTKTNDKNYIALDEVETAEKPPLPKRKYITLTRLEEIYSALVLGTRDYIIKNGFKKVVIGLSGGIDSSLTAVIACDAIGKENVIGVSMPSQYSSQQTQSDTKALANNLGIRLIVVPIASIFKAYL